MECLQHRKITASGPFGVTAFPRWPVTPNPNLSQCALHCCEPVNRNAISSYAAYQLVRGCWHSGTTWRARGVVPWQVQYRQADRLRSILHQWSRCPVCIFSSPAAILFAAAQHQCCFPAKTLEYPSLSTVFPGFEIGSRKFGKMLRMLPGFAEDPARALAMSWTAV